MPRLALALLAAALAPLALPAQDALRGRVLHASTPVPGAVVSVTCGSTTQSAATAADGSFSLQALPAGPATLEVRLFGFQPLRQQLTLPSSTPLALSLSLQPFRAFTARTSAATTQNSEAATVETQVARALELPSAPAADPTESSESFLVQGSLSRGLQEAGRPSFFDFEPGGPGAMMGGGPGAAISGQPGAPGLGGEAGAPQAMGGRPGGMMGGAGPGGGGMMGGGPGGGPGGGMMGGGPGMMGGRGGMRPGGPGGDGPPGMSREDFEKMSPEDRAKLRERFMARRSPEGFGNRSRRARDQIRGGAFLNLRNDAFDAAPFALNGRTTTKPQYSQSRFGASFGGPLVLGKLFTADTSFFFLNYSANRGDSVYNGYAILPEASLRSGDFSSLASTLYDPTSNTPFPANTIPSARISSIARGLLAYIPLPNQTAATQNYQLTTTNPSKSDNLSLRLNRTLNKSNRLSFDWSYQRRNSENVQLFNWRDTSEGDGMNYGLAFNHTFTTHVLFNTRFRYNRNYSNLTPYFANGTNVAAALGISGASQDPANYGPPNLNFTNYGDLTDGNRSRRTNHSFSTGAGFTFILGAHNLSTGVDFTRTRQNTLSDPNGRGTLFFGGLATSLLDAAGLPVSGTGNDFADFLLASVQQSTIRYGAPDSYMRQSNYGAYLQDEWRARPNLTLNLGLRWDDWEPFTEKYNRIANIDISPDSTAAAIVTPGATGPWSGTTPAGLIHSDRNNLSPRAGLSWRPWAKKRVTVRTGYSLFFDSSIYSRIPSRLTYQPPFATSSTFNTSSAYPLTLANPFQGPAGTTISNTYAVNPNFKVPYAQTWNLSISQEYKGYIFETGYLGTKGTGLLIQRIPNRADPGSPASSENRRPISYATAFTYDSPEGSSIFHAGQLRVVRRMRRGANFSALYTFSKSIDNASSLGGSGNTVVQNDKDLAAERGLSAFDVRHNFQLSGMIASPFGPNGSLLRRRNTLTAFLKDWSIMSSLNLNSGRPLTARVLGAVADAAGSGAATGSARADSTGASIASSGAYFNTAAFTTPPANRYGNAGRNTIPGPGAISLNASFGRSFQLGDSARRRLEARAEAENILNHANITGYGTVVNSATYGLATSAGSMRSIQLTLRLRF